MSTNKFKDNLKVKFNEKEIVANENIYNITKGKKKISIDFNEDKISALTNYNLDYAKQLIDLNAFAGLNLTIGNKVYMMAGFNQDNVTSGDRYFGIYPNFTCNERNFEHDFTVQFTGQTETKQCDEHQYTFEIYKLI